ncbi:23S rRNA (guanosine(2251)-2'-O)-methyltransferase RlmB [candidate division KSB3 bacterium]|uniref:23S rRNA (Guanosine(2251)-2'-O)-methyltransferase RlmB n=1 Tax=candidate division KSB3 bacterium TaxID=2044937 RepID=A0A9D5Q7H4_9BACT|nr:23S rRNA (guanosine(2251)-2'-O)-methyltransferase RlmB [candidate division KSB3 bacterium]MBD3326894.1 23S rRNA (guanosine(2251)-2'-O)-methyltransferase RlmB [candidate division KSB3 bacterium]
MGISGSHPGWAYRSGDRDQRSSWRGKYVDAAELNNLIFGIHPVQEALRSGQAFERLYVCGGRKKRPAIAEILSLAKAQRIEVRFEPWERLTARAGGTPAHQGVIGITPSFAYTAFDELVAASLTRAEPPLLLLLDQIQDPQNLGAIIRSAECAGVHGIIIPKRKSAEITPAVVKVSAGATSYMPICRITNMAATLDRLKDEYNIWVIGSAHTVSQAYTATDLTMPVALVIGNEEKGIRRLVAEKCDLMVSIPLSGHIASLNASVAAALLMFEVRRQRQA